MASARDISVYRKDQASSGTILSASEREALLRKYLPAQDDMPSTSNPPPSSSSPRTRRKPIRTFIKTQIHLLFFTLIQLMFGLFIRVRRLCRALKSIFLQVLYHHHRTPELINRDVAPLKRIPKHLSVILTLPDAHTSRRRGLRRVKELLPSAALDALLDEVAELAVWSAAAGIPLLSIYEPTGVLKNCVPATHRVVRAHFGSYFGEMKAPTLQIRAPHMPSYLHEEDAAASAKHYEYDSPAGGDDDAGHGHLDLLLLSEEDGRATMVDLTKTLAEMSQKGKITPRDVGVDLIDAELSESFSAVEPDLLMLFGDRIILQGYPPWQLHHAEIYCAGEGSGGAVDYPTWLKGLYRFARAEMRFGH